VHEVLRGKLAGFEPRVRAWRETMGAAAVDFGARRRASGLPRLTPAELHMQPIPNRRPLAPGIARQPNLAAHRGATRANAAPANAYRPCML